MWPRRRQPTRLPRPWDSQARILEWVAISFSNAWKWKVKVSFNCGRLLATPWAAAYQAPLSMGFSRQEYWSGVPLPSPIVDLQWCVNFCCRAEWLSHTYMYSLFHILFHYALSQDKAFITVLSSRTLFFIHPVYKFVSAKPNVQSFPPSTSPLPWQLQVCSLCLWVCFCFTDRFPCAIFYIPHISDIIWYLPLSDFT